MNELRFTPPTCAACAEPVKPENCQVDYDGRLICQKCLRNGYALEREEPTRQAA